MEKQTQLVAIARIREAFSDKKWEEPFDVSSEAAARQEVLSVVEAFNEIKGDGPTRIFVRIVRFDKREIPVMPILRNDVFSEDDDLYDEEDDYDDED